MIHRLVVWVISQFSPLYISRSKHAYLKMQTERFENVEQYVRLYKGLSLRSCTKIISYEYKNEDFFKAT